MEQNYKEAIFAVAVAMYGAIANVLSSAKPPRGSSLAKELLKGIVIAGFCGMIVFLAARYLKVGVYEQSLAAGIAGYMGGRFLQTAEKKFMKKFLPE